MTNKWNGLDSKDGFYIRLYMDHGYVGGGGLPIHSTIPMMYKTK